MVLSRFRCRLRLETDETEVPEFFVFGVLELNICYLTLKSIFNREVARGEEGSLMKMKELVNNRSTFVANDVLNLSSVTLLGRFLTISRDEPEAILTTIWLPGSKQRISRIRDQNGQSLPDFQQSIENFFTCEFVLILDAFVMI